MIEIVMPRLSDSMEEGTILRWLVADGEMVRRGDELLEVETDKAAMVHNSDADGMLEIISPEGATVAVGEPIGRLLQVEEEAAVPVGQPGEDGSVTDDLTGSIDATDIPQGADSGEENARGPAPATAAARSAAGRVPASPVAKRIADDLGIDLSQVTGSGPHGRIIRSDVEAAAGSALALPEGGNGELVREPQPAEGDSARVRGGEPGQATETAKGAVERIEPTRAQSLIARRMSESRATVPDFTLEVEVHAERLGDIRDQLRELDEGNGSPTVNDLIIKACALALRDHRQINGAWRDGAFELYERINIGIAAATPGGLVVPVIFDADSKHVSEIARETRELISRARAGTITPPELSGGTFSISNLGMFGIDRFTAVINPPQSAMLAVGSLRDAPVVEEGEIVAGKLMSLTLAVDHRSVYGAPAAAFLATVRERLEAPASLIG